VRATVHVMDALSAVLASVRLQQMCWVSTVGRAPWGMALPRGECRVRFHYVVRGNAWLTVDKADEPRVALAGGDLAVMPHGHGHTLRDHPRSSARSWAELATPSSQKAPGVASLAEEVGLSRSVFAARFAQLVGEPPLGYLMRLRMQKAATLLRDGATLAQASHQTGYGSEASFSHAFRQWAGVAPGAYRKQLRES